MNDHVFKVPSVKKRKPSLYCSETLDGLDDVWRKPQSSKKIDKTCREDQGMSPKGESKNTFAHVEGRQYTCQEPFHQNDSMSSGKKYPLGLAKELSQNSSYSDTSNSTSPRSASSHACSTSTQRMSVSNHMHQFSSFGSENQTVPDVSISNHMHQYSSCGRENQTVPDICSNPLQNVSISNHMHQFPSLGSDHQTVPDVCSSSSSMSDDEMNLSPDILILRNDSMAKADSDSSDSDVDWDSLTPPAPRSPGDHTVPDMYDMESIVPPSDCLMHAYDFLASMPRSQLIRNQFGVDHSVPVGNTPGISQFQVNHRMQSIDHVVPDFF